MVRMAIAMLAALAVGVPATQMTGDKPYVVSGHEVQTRLAQLVEQAKVTHHGDAELARTGNLALQLSVMAVNGPGELHRHFDDMLMIQQGTATLVTGGTMQNPRPERPNGDTYGSGLEGGQSQTLSPGDIAIIPAGLTHQLLLPQGGQLVMVVGKIQEQ